MLDEELLAEREKHIILADKSEHGWKTVHEYKRNYLADDSDDEKKIIRAEARATSQARQNFVNGKLKFGSLHQRASTSLSCLSLL